MEYHWKTISLIIHLKINEYLLNYFHWLLSDIHSKASVIFHLNVNTVFKQFVYLPLLCYVSSSNGLTIFGRNPSVDGVYIVSGIHFVPGISAVASIPSIASTPAVASIPAVSSTHAVASTHCWNSTLAGIYTIHKHIRL